MTRRLPPETLQASVAVRRDSKDWAFEVFRGKPTWMAFAARAALAQLRPDLKIAIEPSWRDVHQWNWPRNGDYFLGVCKLFKIYGVGEQWGES